MTDETVMREVLTKAVCGKGQLLQQNIVEIPVTSPHEVQVLGSYVTKARLKSAVPVISGTNKKLVRVEGQYDVHLWYAAGQDTNSIKKTVNYIETIPINTFGDDDIIDAQAFAEITSRPVCKKTYVNNTGGIKKIKVEVEQGLAAEVIGMTKLFVKATPFGPPDDEIISGEELVPPKTVAMGLLVPEFYPDQIEDLCEDDFEK